LPLLVIPGDLQYYIALVIVSAYSIVNGKSKKGLPAEESREKFFLPQRQELLFY
jgi:hypothetical protein